MTRCQNNIKLPTMPDTNKKVIFYLEYNLQWIPGSEWCVSPSTQTLYFSQPLTVPWMGEQEIIQTGAYIWVGYTTKESPINR